MKRLMWLATLASFALCGCGNFFTSQSSGSGSGSGTGSSNTTSGDVLYVANLTASNLTALLVSTTGALSAVSGSPYALGEPPSSLAITPGNTFLYIGTASGLIGYKIGTNGVLTQLNSGAALITDIAAPTGLIVDTTGNYLFAAGIALASGTNTPEVGLYQINTSTGGLTEVNGSPVTVANGNGSTTGVPTQLYMAPNNEFLYLTLGTGGTEMLTFDEGTANLLDTGTHIDLTAGGASQNQVIANAASTMLFLTETGSGARVFNIGTNGVPSSEVAGSPFAAGTGPTGIMLNGAGTNLYVTDKGASSTTDLSGSISGFSVSSTGTIGALTAIASSPYAAGTLPLFLTLDQSKNFLAVANSGGTPDLGVYSFDATTPGKLDSTATAAATSPSGAFMVVSTH